MNRNIQTSTPKTGNNKSWEIVPRRILIKQQKDMLTLKVFLLISILANLTLLAVLKLG